MLVLGGMGTKTHGMGFCGRQIWLAANPTRNLTGEKAGARLDCVSVSALRQLPAGSGHRKSKYNKATSLGASRKPRCKSELAVREMEREGEVVATCSAGLLPIHGAHHSSSVPSDHMSGQRSENKENWQVGPG